MAALKDTYDIIKDLLNEAKKLKNFDFVEKVIEIQEKFFELRDENQKNSNIIEKQRQTIEQLEDSLKKFNLIKEENKELKEKLLVFEKSEDLSFLNESVKLKYIEIKRVFLSNTAMPIVNIKKESLKEIYLHIAPKLLISKSNNGFCDLFNKTVDGINSYLDYEIIGKLKAKFLEYGLIEIKESSNDIVKIYLTEFGKQVLYKINNI